MRRRDLFGKIAAVAAGVAVGTAVKPAAAVAKSVSPNELMTQTMVQAYQAGFPGYVIDSQSRGSITFNPSASWADNLIAQSGDLTVTGNATFLGDVTVSTSPNLALRDMVDHFEAIGLIEPKRA